MNDAPKPEHEFDEDATLPPEPRITEPNITEPEGWLAGG